MKQGTIVLLRGQLKGMGLEAECDLLARRIKWSAPGDERSTLGYTGCVILTAPADLPDGDYMAFFSGHSLPVNRTRGLWVPIGEAIRDSASDALPEGREVVPVSPPDRSVNADSPSECGEASEARQIQVHRPSES